ncbi:MAG: glycine zipper 2TM domain-containing protein [Pseudomonadales bacterium]
MISARTVTSFLAAALLPSLVWAGDRYQYADVLSAQPIYDTVAYTVPTEQCRQQTVAYREPQGRSVTAPIVGAIVGGALGNAVGSKKRNKQVGTAVGAVLGGSLGADVARRNRAYGNEVRYATEEVCSVVHEHRTEQRLAGYHVTYRYAGETYTTRLNRDPGSALRVRVQVTPVG